MRSVPGREETLVVRLKAPMRIDFEPVGEGKEKAL